MGTRRCCTASQERNGAYPWAGLIDVGGLLYGAAFAGGPGGLATGVGTIFRLDPATGTETVLHSFKAGADGANPTAELLYYAGLLYGTTVFGGSSNDGGTVFKVDPCTGTETVLHRFSGGNPLAGVIAQKGFLYGMFQSGVATVFRLNPVTRAETEFPNYGGSYASLLSLDNFLYGTSPSAGTRGLGTVFRFDPSTGVGTTVYEFAGGTDGSDPEAALIYQGGYLYGTTRFGGAGCTNRGGCGTVFRLDPVTSTESIPHTFKGGADGREPRGRLIYIGGSLYGTTSKGTKSQAGTVFRLTP